MRIGLISDTHGSIPALQAALAACRTAAPDMIVHAGDFLSSPFSPDPPGETIALLGNEGHSTGPHLHFEVRIGGKDGKKVDPIGWLHDRGVEL